MHHSQAEAQPRPLTAIKGTHTPIYVLKLFSDPSITKVPASPGFPSSPDAVSDNSAAHTRRSRHAVRFRTSRDVDSHHFWIGRVCARCRAARVRVAQHLRPIGLDWVERELSFSSARCSLASQCYPAQSYGGLQRLGESLLVLSDVCMFAVGGLPAAPWKPRCAPGRPLRLRFICPAFARLPSLAFLLTSFWYSVLILVSSGTSLSPALPRPITQH
jgi:hypothetical protein